MKVLTQGSFDLFHHGHVNLLRRCQNLGELYIGVITDDSYEEYRGYSPHDNLETRMEKIRTRFPLANVFPTEPYKMRDDIHRFTPDIIAIGNDWATKDIYKQWDVTPAEIDDRLVYIPYTQGISSTQIKKEMNK